MSRVRTMAGLEYRIEHTNVMLWHSVKRVELNALVSGRREGNRVDHVFVGVEDGCPKSEQPQVVPDRWGSNCEHSNVAGSADT